MATNLQLKVILSAIDRITAPIKKATKSSAALGKQVKETRAHLNALRDQSGAIDGVRKLTQATWESRKALQQKQAALRQISETLASTTGPTKRLTQQQAAAQRQVEKLSARYRDQRQKLQSLQSQIPGNVRGSRNLADTQKTLARQIDQVSASLKGQQKQMAALNHQQLRAKELARKHGKTMQHQAMVAATGYAAYSTGRQAITTLMGPVIAYSSFEDAMLGVARQVEGARDANGQLTPTYYKMADGVLAMARRIPMATNEIAALVEAGARMGIKGQKNLMGFAKNTAISASAFDLPVDQIGDDMGKIASLYKIPIARMGELGDAINWLDDNAQSKGGDIINVLQRIAGIATSAGMNFKEAAALGSTFLSLGANKEIAGTAANAMIRELQIATIQPKKFQKGIAALHLNAQQLQDGMATDATGTIIKVLEAIKRIDPKKQTEVATQLFGKEYGDDAAKLANNLAEYRRQLELVNAVESKGSMQREFEARNSSLSARWQLAKNRWFEAQTGAGDTLKPVAIDIMNQVGGLLEKLSGWIKANPQLTATILKSAAAVAAFVAVMGVLAFALASIASPFLIASFLMRRAWMGSKLLAPAIKGLASGLLWLGGKPIAMVLSGFKTLGLFLLANPIVLAIALIIAAGYLLWKNWHVIKAGLLTIWNQLGGSIHAVLATISAAIINWSPLGLFYKAFASVMGWFGIQLPGKFTEFGAMIIRGLANGITSAIGMVKNAITGIGDKTIGWFKDKLGIHSPSRVFAALGDDTMAGLALGLNRSHKSPLAAMAGIGKKLTTSTMLAASIGVAPGALAIDNRPPLAPQRAPVVIEGDHITINITAAPGANAEDLARIISNALDDRSHQKRVRARTALYDQQ